MLDRLFVKSLIARIAGAIQPTPSRSLAVLTYHSVGSAYSASLPTTLFARHLKQLILLSGMPCLDWRRKAESQSFAHACLVTFDDGYMDNYKEALPVLEDYGVRALFFITTAFVEQDLDITRSFKSYNGLKPMGWDEVGELVERGHSIGMHGHTHRNFANMTQREAADEFSVSLEIFKRRLGIVPDCFAYPFGQFQHRRADITQIASTLPLRYTFTTDHRLARLDDLSASTGHRLISRLRIDAKDSPEVLAQKVSGAWDYIASLQRIKACVAMRSFTPLILDDR